MSFPNLRHFKPEEFTYPDLMDETTLIQLDSMRDTFVRLVFTINSDYRPGDKGWHGCGKAIDGVIRSLDTWEPLPVVEQFIIASKFLWGGIGMYPFWNTPGLHLDTRPMVRFGKRAYWYRNAAGVYVYHIQDIFSADFSRR